MDGATLLRHLKSIQSLDNCHVELFASNDVWCAPPKLPSLFIINTGYSQQSGEHYISFYMHKDMSVTFFDSYGIPPYSCVKTFFKKHGFRPVRYNTELLQSPFSDVCGLYQIAFAAFISSGINLRGFLHGFTDDYDINDKHIRDFVSSIVDVR